MIHLTVQVEDVEVEKLLSYLNAHTEDEIEDSIDLLKRTLKWLCAAVERSYDVNPDSEAVLQLTVDAPSLIAAPPSRRPSEQP